MPRMTRAKAQEVAEHLHIDEDAVLELASENSSVLKHKVISTPEPTERNPLAELAPNSGGNSTEEDQKTELRKFRRGRKGGKRDDKVEGDGGEQVQGLTDEGGAVRERTDSLGETAADGSMEDGTKLGEDMQAVSPETTGASDVVKPKVLLQTETSPSVDGVSISNQHADTDQHLKEPATQIDNDEPTSPLPSAMPQVIQRLRRDTPAKRSTSNKENVEPMTSTATQSTPTTSARYDALEAAVVEAATPPAESELRQTPASNARPKEPTSPSRSQDSITALDDLEDAVEAVTAQVPDVHASPAKPKSQPDTQSANKSPVKTQHKKAAPIVRATKASQARISLAHPSTDAEKRTLKSSALGKPRPSTAFARSSTLPMTSDAQTQQKAPVNIPHSKPRPVSLSFPTPPPPPKSRKPPTKSTFQLPGEAVAAKLKAAREERTKAESGAGSELTKKSDHIGKDGAKGDDGVKRVPFKARPVPASMSKAGPVVRQTSTSKARESLIAGGAPGAKSAPIAALQPKPSSFRTSTARPSTKAAPISTSSKGAAASPSQLKVTKRPSTIVPKSGTNDKVPKANSSAPRTSLISTSGPAGGSRPSTISNAVPSPRTISTLTKPSTSSSTTTTSKKGREVFGRAALAQNAAAEEKKAKEEAAKQARAAAAERGRVLSREWAEKNKKKKLAGKGGPAAAIDGKEKGQEAETVEADVASTKVDESISDNDIDPTVGEGQAGKEAMAVPVAAA